MRWKGDYTRLFDKYIIFFSVSSLILTVQGILSGNKVAIPISYCESLRMSMDTQKVSNVLIYSPKQADVRNHLRERTVGRHETL